MSPTAEIRRVEPSSSHAYALPWAILAVSVAYLMGTRLAAFNQVHASDLWLTCTVGTFALLLASVAVLRRLSGRPGGALRLLGLPGEDWAFAFVFSTVVGTAGWIALL